MSSIFVSNVPVYFVKCHPKRPSLAMDPTKPQWELQLRTTDPAVHAEWEALKLPSKFHIPKGKGPADGFYRCNLSKRAFKKDGSPTLPVEVVTGDLRPLDPDTIGNGSIANLRLLAREYTHNNAQKTAWYLMAIQVTVLRPYEGGNKGFDSAGFQVEQEDTGEDTPDEGNSFTAKPVQFVPPSANPARSPTDF